MDCIVCNVYLNKTVISIKAVSVNLRKGFGVGCGKGFRCVMEGGMQLNSPVTHLPHLPVELETEGVKGLRPDLWTYCPAYLAPSLLLTNNIAWLPWVIDQLSNIFSCCPVLPCLVRMSIPPLGIVLLPRRRPGRTQIAWRDKMFGFFGKEGWEIEPDTWQGPQAGQPAGEVGLYSTPGLSRPAPRLGSWQRPEQASPGWGGVGMGGRSPMGNEKAQRFVMAGLAGFCVLMFTIKKRFVCSCQRLWDSQ